MAFQFTKCDFFRGYFAAFYLAQKILQAHKILPASHYKLQPLPLQPVNPFATYKLAITKDCTNSLDTKLWQYQLQ